VQYDCCGRVVAVLLKVWVIVGEQDDEVTTSGEQQVKHEVTVDDTVRDDEVVSGSTAVNETGKQADCK